MFKFEVLAKHNIDTYVFFRLSNKNPQYHALLKIIMCSSTCVSDGAHIYTHFAQCHSRPPHWSTLHPLSRDLEYTLLLDDGWLVRYHALLLLQ